MPKHAAPEMTTDIAGIRHVGIPISGEDARGAIEAIGRSAPEVARTSRDAVLDTMRWLEGGSDDRITTGAMLSLGVAIGMLVGGAPRILVAVALLPVAALGLVVGDRRRRARPPG